jgi:hypothetical protein
MTQSPEMIVQGAIHANYPGADVVPRSRAHYGFRLSRPFQDGDPEWSCFEDNWDHIDKCEVRVTWQVQKVRRGILENLIFADTVPRTSYSTLMPLSHQIFIKYSDKIKV